MTDVWYYSCDDKPLGPIPIADLRAMAARGTLKPTDLVWTPGMSQWAPASMTRGLFPPLPKVQPTVPASRLPLSSPQPALESRQSRRDDDMLRISRSSRTKPRPKSMGSGTRVLIAFGIAFAVVVGIVGAVLIIDVANSPRKRARSARFFPPPPPVQAQPAPVFKGGARVNPGGPGAIPSNGEYEVELSFKVLEDTHVLHFNQNEMVHITVTTTDWGLGDEPDVDLYVYSPLGVEIASDKGPEKDCRVAFLAPMTGDYSVVVRLDRGGQARCKVRY